jgi:glycosyltransferase involved in cell wall biosynthesis
VFKRCAKARKPIIVTCFDLIPELYGGNKETQRENAYAYAAATHIIAISENTKRDLCDFYNVSEDKVSVVYLGGNMQSVAKADCDSPVEVDRYILYVGNRAGYKNFAFFVRAVAPIVKSNSLKVFCTGSAFSKTELDLLERLGVRSKFIQQFVSDEQLPNLYHGALAFVYPSLHEGFGIPILDAFAVGCPTLLSNATCFPEVGGDAALYFDPKDEDDFRRQLMRVIGDDDETKKFRTELIERGKDRAKMFSWKKCAEETAEVYKAVVASYR